MKRYFTPLHMIVALALAVLCGVASAHGFDLATGVMLIAPVGIATLEELAAEFTTQSSELKTRQAELKEAHAELTQRYEKGDVISKELKESIDKCLTNFNGLKGHVDELEQKLTQRVVEDSKAEKTWGQQFIESNSFKSSQAEYGDGLSGKRGVIGSTSVKQITQATAGGLLLRPIREAEVVGLMGERRVMRDLLPSIPVNTAAVEYARQITRTNNAAPVAESIAKPYSDYAWDVVTVNIRTIAHLAKLTRQALDDAPRLAGEIDSEMRYGLGYVEERQLLYGTGVGQNLNGIIPQATAFARPAGIGTMAGATAIDVLRVAMLQNVMALLPADGIVLNAVDWAGIELTKDAQGRYIFADPQAVSREVMWGLPVVATPAMTAGDFLVGAFGQSATIYDRMGVEVLISTENTDDFEKNLATMRAEERMALAVKRPAGFTKGTFATAITALKA